MSPSLTTFLFEVANFALLAWLLSWLFFKPVRKALDGRRAEEKKAAEEAAAKLAAAEKLREEMSRERDELAVRLEELRSSSQIAAKKEADAILSEGQLRLAREREQFERQLETLRQAQADRLAAAVAVATREIILRFITKIDASPIDTALVREACRELERLGKESFSRVTVESAKPLDADSRSALLGATGGRSEDIEFRVVGELGAGVRVSTNRGLIDASWAGLADYAKRAVEAELRDRAGGP